MRVKPESSPFKKHNGVALATPYIFFEIHAASCPLQRATCLVQGVFYTAHVAVKNSLLYIVFDKKMRFAYSLKILWQLLAIGFFYYI